jgi:hypothetical protein
LLAVVPYAAARVAERATGLDGDALAVRRARMHAVVFVVVGLAGVAAAYFLRRSLLLLGCPRAHASLLTVAYALGTPAFPFSTVLYGHEVTAALLVASFYFILRGRGREPSWPGCVALGVLGGAALVTEYPAAIAVGLLWVLLVSLHVGARPIARATLGTALGAALPLGVHALYCALALGSPLDLPYRHLVDPVFSAGGLHLANITAASVYGNFLGAFRGLFFFSPVLALSFVGLAFWLGAGEAQRPLAFVAAVLAAYGVFTCSFYYWDGGMSVGPRHLVPVLPFFVLPLAFVARRGRAWLALVATTTAVSVVVMFACTAVRVELPAEEKNPLADVVLASLVRGEVATNHESPFGALARADASYNLGTFAGLSPCASLAVLPAVWGLGLSFPRGRWRRRRAGGERA